jgi:membrane-bound lytic murein transglycosylase A
MNTAMSVRSPAARGWGAALFALSLAACTTPPAPGGGAPAPAPVAAVPAPAPAAAPVPAPAAASDTPSSAPRSSTGPGGGSVAGQARTFSTQLATYTSVSFNTVPGWDRDDFSESWPAFLGSCRVLTGRGAEWRAICDRARQVDARSNIALRDFFEREL